MEQESEDGASYYEANLVPVLANSRAEMTQTPNAETGSSWRQFDCRNRTVQEG